MSKHIYKVEPPKGVDLKSDVGEVELQTLPHIPHAIAIIGSVRAGKTALWANMYCSNKFPYKKLFDVKILISGTAGNDKMLKNIIDEDFDFVFDTYSDELLLEIISMIEQDQTDSRYVIIFEDIIGNINIKRTGSTDALTSLVTRYRHVGNDKMAGKLSIVVVTQYFKYLNSIMRLNLSNYFIMGNSSESELKKYSEEFSVFGSSSKKFLEIYKQSKQKKFDFLYLDMKQLKAYRNFETVIWSDDDDKENIKPLENIKEEEEEEEEE